MSLTPKEIENADTFERCPHDKQNPYVMVSRDLIRDKSISPNCRWLIIYLLSNQEGWKIRVPFIISHLEGHVGRDKVYKIINEGIQAGYIKRVEFLDHGRKKFKYFVSESPKFKECLLYPENQDTEIQYTENQDTKEITSSSIPIEEKKEQSKEGPTSSPPSADADLLTVFFFNKIKERNPEFRKPNLQKWAQHVDKMLKIDKRDPEKIMNVIAWAADHKWWKSACLSTEKLRKSYDEMVMQMAADEEKDVVRKNRQYVLELKEQYPEQLKRLSFDDKYVMNHSEGKEIRLNMPHEEFKDAFVSMFGGSRG